jgi:hypothetical protein
MTKSAVRGYAVALSLLGFSAVWAATAHKPFPQQQATQTGAAAADPRIAALDARAAQLRRQAAEVSRILAGRRADAVRQAAARVVSAPPVTQTSTS